MTPELEGDGFQRLEQELLPGTSTYFCGSRQDLFFNPDIIMFEIRNNILKAVKTAGVTKQPDDVSGHVPRYRLPQHLAQHQP